MKNGHGSIGTEGGVLAQSVGRDVVVVSQRQRILEGIAACCADKTYADTTIGDIVSRAGVSRRTFYKLFANKRDCFEAAINTFAEEISEIAETVEPGRDLWPMTIRQAIGELLELLAAKPAFANLALIEAIGVEPTLINRYWEPLIGALQKFPTGGDRVSSTGTARAAVGAAQVLIAQRVIGGQAERLPELLPDIVYIALAPFVGQEEALAQARLAR